MAHEVETMFSARQVPWHGLGEVTEDALTAQEAIVTAGIDWTVETLPVFLGDGQLVPDSYAVVRNTDRKPLSVVGSKWTPLQNHEAFEFLDNLTDTGLAYETAGALKGGKVTFVTARLPEDVLIGGEDAHRFFLFVRNPFNGRDAVTIGVTPVRIVCQNTMNLALRQTKRVWRAPHLSSLKGRLAEARHSLELTWQYAEEFKELGDHLLTQHLSDADFGRFLDECVKAVDGPKAQESAHQGVARIYHEVERDRGHKGTAWGALNAVGEFFDWEREIRSAEGRLISSLDGQARKMRDRALTLLS